MHENERIMNVHFPVKFRAVSEKNASAVSGTAIDPGKKTADTFRIELSGAKQSC